MTPFVGIVLLMAQEWNKNESIFWLNRCFFRKDLIGWSLSYLTLRIFSRPVATQLLRFWLKSHPQPLATHLCMKKLRANKRNSWLSHFMPLVSLYHLKSSDNVRCDQWQEMGQKTITRKRIFRFIVAMASFWYLYC